MAKKKIPRQNLAGCPAAPEPPGLDSKDSKKHKTPPGVRARPGILFFGAGRVCAGVVLVPSWRCSFFALEITERAPWGVAPAVPVPGATLRAFFRYGGEVRDQAGAAES